MMAGSSGDAVTGNELKVRTYKQIDSDIYK